MSYFDQQCLQALQGIERNLDRIATTYEKTEKVKMGVIDPCEAFPEYKDIFEAREKEIRETWMPHYELSPKKEPTYGDIFRRFKDKYPSLANHVEDYRPAEEPNSIVIWLDIMNATTRSSIIVYNDETAKIKEA